MKIITIAISILCLIILPGCDALKYKKVDAKDFPADPKLRTKKNMEEGRGFRIMGGNNGGTTYSFATANPLWRATLDSLDFMQTNNEIIIHYSEHLLLPMALLYRKSRSVCYPVRSSRRSSSAKRGHKGYLESKANMSTLVSSQYMN